MNLFIPDAYYNNVFDINFNKLKKNNFKFIFFDVDNTLLPYTENIPSKKINDLFNKLKKDGFKLILISNSNSSRINNIKTILDVDAYTSSMKPLKKKYKKIIKKYEKEKCVFIGDQIMTDVLGAKRNKLYVVLLDRIDEKEPITTKFWRFLEKIVMKINKFERGKYYE